MGSTETASIHPKDAVTYLVFGVVTGTQYLVFGVLTGTQYFVACVPPTDAKHVCLVHFDICGLVIFLVLYMVLKRYQQLKDRENRNFY